ncbi:MAG TPA: SulP family inorganic anion transporter [Bacteroidia bacterium]|nr:SulP family inorganic anion transporter [Bacteroidia bacterium]
MKYKFHIEDISASVIVFFVAVPLCLGIALASGTPPISGLISGIIGGIVVGIISNSALGVSGPAAGLVAICLSAISTLGNLNDFFLSVVLAGILQIIFGIIRLGKLSYYFPSSVITGMLTSIGIIIILKQLPHAFGYDKDFEGDIAFNQPDEQNTFTELINFWRYIHPASTIIFFSGLIVLSLWQKLLSKIFPKFTRIVQYPLAIVIFGVLIVMLLNSIYPGSISKEHLVYIPPFNELSSSIKIVEWNNIASKNVWYFAFIIAFVASIETLLCVEAADNLDPQKRITNRNRELVAQGIGNFLSGLIGGLPITQVIVRSSTNISFNAKTKLSTILHGVWLLLSVVFLNDLLNLIPLASLATILIIVGFNLSKPSTFSLMYKKGKTQFIPFVITIIAILFSDLLIGTLIGLVSSIIIQFYNASKNSIKVIKNENNNLIIHIDDSASFMNKSQLINY